MSFAHWEGYAEQGGQEVTTAAVDSITKVQQSYPFATLTVYITGSSPQTLATLYSDSSGTPLANPFTCSRTGYFSFYAADGTLDLTFSGLGISSPFTWGAVQRVDPDHVPLVIMYVPPSRGGGTFAVQAAAALAAGKYLGVATTVASIPTTNIGAAKVWMLPGGLLQVAASATLTMPVPFAQPNQRIFDTSASGAAVKFTGVGDLQMEWWGADPTTVVDSTAFIQAALLATGRQVAQTPPLLDRWESDRTLRAGTGVYRITSTVYVPNGTTWLGANAGDLVYTTGGSTLQWFGAAPAVAYADGSAIVQLRNPAGANKQVNGTLLEGINLDGAGTTNLSGYSNLIAGIVGSQGTHQRNAVRQFVATRFGDPATDVPGAAINFGDENAYDASKQIDGVDVTDFSVSSSYIGVRINNANFAYSKFERFVMIDINKCFDDVLSGFHMIQQGAVGRMMGTSPVVINIRGIHGPLLIQQLQAEQGVTAKFLNIGVTGGLGGDPSPITLISNIFDFPSTIAQPNQVIISKGNLSNPANPITITSAATAVRVTTENDTDVNWDIQSVSADVKDIGMPQDRLSIVNFITNLNSSNSRPIAVFGVNALATTDTEPFNRYETLTSQKWRMIWSALKWGIRDQTASNYLALSIDNGCSGLDVLQIKHDSTVVAGQTFTVSGAANRKPGRYWFATQAGSNGAITVTTTDGTWQPTLGDMVSVYLSANTLLAASANTIQINGGPVYGILSHFNSSNIPTGYVVTAIWTGIFGSSNIFKDISQ